MSNDLDLLLPQHLPKPNSVKWATVTSTAGGSLEVRPDGEDDSLPVQTLVNPAVLNIGDRVFVYRDGLRRIVLGVAGGLPSP